MTTELELPANAQPEAFPDDSDFPQLRMAVDAGVMLDVFRAHLTPVPGTACQIRQCAPFRFRCRQASSRCVLQYTLRLVDPETGREWDQGVTGVVYGEAGKAEQVWHELEAVVPHTAIPERWRTLEPVTFIPALDMVVVVFPFDRRLPNLAPVMSGRAAASIDPLLLARLDAGDWIIEERTLEPMRYRTELGAALRYSVRAREVRSERSSMLRCYLKVYRHDRGEETLRLLESLRERGHGDGSARGQGRYAVVKPLAYLRDVRTLALEEASGSSLQQLLLQGHDPVATARPVARAVAALHQDDPGPTRRETLSDQLEDLALAATLVQWACPEARAEVAAIAATVARGLEDVPPAPIHGDLKADHVFLSGDRVIFIDLDSMVRGDPVRDPAHLFAYLTGAVGLGSLPAARARAAAAAFMEEYFRHVPARWRARFPLHCAGALIEVASGIFRRQEPHWRAQVPAVVAAARRALSGELL